jgi:heme ABC exporter ATP-binding subunit CcmA
MIPGRIAVQAVGLVFERDRRRFFDGVDLLVAPGEILSITGSNGAGKTTLIKLLAGLLEPCQGDVRWFGGAARTAWDLRRQVGYVGHRDHLCRDLTAFENLLFAARLHRLSPARDVAKNALHECGLGPKGDCVVARMSQGECRRLSLARAIIHRPGLLLLDEPFSNLDDRARAWLEVSLRQWRLAGRAICYTTHEVEHCQAIADRTVRLDRGRVVPPFLRSA